MHYKPTNYNNKRKSFLGQIKLHRISILKNRKKVTTPTRPKLVTNLVMLIVIQNLLYLK